MPAQYEEYIAESQFDGFLVGMLYPAMYYGEDIHIDGCVSDKLIFNIRNYIVPLLLGFSSSLKPISVTVREVTERNYKGAGVGTGFSGGVDSFCTVFDRYVLETSRSHKVNSLTFFNVGSNGDWLQDGSIEFTRNKFTTRHKALKKFTDEIGLDFIAVDTNLHFFHDWWHSYSHTLKAASVVLLLQRYYSRYYYSSAGLNYAGVLKYSDGYRNKDVGAYCDPILLPLLSTESLDLVSDGCAYTRSEKLLHILDYEPVGRYLNVCVNHVDKWENCSECDKCLRTLLTLDVSGNLEKVKNIFNLDAYGVRRYEYLLSQVEKSATDPFAADNIGLAKSLGLGVPSPGLAQLRLNLKRLMDLPARVSRKIL